MISLVFCLSLNAFEIKLLAEGGVLTDSPQKGNNATLSLSDNSRWGCKVLTMKMASWFQWLRGIDPEQEFPSEFYFDFSNWKEGDRFNVFLVEEPPFPAYPYLVENGITGDKTFARFLPIIGLYCPTRKMVDAITQRAPSVEGMIKEIYPNLTYGVIALEDKSLWKVFPVIKKTKGAEWRHGKEFEEFLEAFDFDLCDWERGQELKFYKCNSIHLGIMSKYFSNGGATLYLLENAEAGNIASVCPITEQELTYLQAEYEEDHTATIHGMTVNDLTPELAKQYGYISNTQGVIVTQVDTGSPAAKSDFCPGFIILAYNNNKVKNLRELKMAIENAADKGSLLLLCRHGDLTRFYTLTLN